MVTQVWWIICDSQTQSERKKYNKIGNKKKQGGKQQDTVLKLPVTRNDDMAQCKSCQDTFTNETDMLLICERCSQWCCSTCVGITGIEYTFLSSRRDIHWHCTTCEEQASMDIKTGRDIEERCKVYFDRFSREMEKKFEDVKSEIKFSLIHEIKQELNEEMKAKSNVDITILKSEMKKNVEVAVKATKEKDDRKLNVIIFQAPESTSIIKDEILDQDKTFVTKTFNDILELDSEQSSDIVKTLRLGRKKDNENRPLLVTLGSEETKKKVMRNLYQLKDKNQTIKINHDMTPEERKELRDLIQEAEKKTKEEESGDFVFRVRGPPWDRRIVRIKAFKATTTTNTN